MRFWSKDTNKIYMITSRGLFMCRVPQRKGLHGFGIGESMQQAYLNAMKHQKYMIYWADENELKDPWFTVVRRILRKLTK